MPTNIEDETLDLPLWIESCGIESCEPERPAADRILDIIWGEPDITLADARKSRFFTDPVGEEFREMFGDEPDDAYLYDLIRRSAAAGHAKAEQLMEEMRSRPNRFLGSVLALAAADKHPGWEKTYCKWLTNSSGWNAALCRKIGDGPADKAALIAWLREAHPDEAAEVEANAIDLLHADRAIVAEAAAERRRQIEMKYAEVDAQAGRADCIKTIAREFIREAQNRSPEKALGAALRKVPDATVAEVERALARVCEEGSDYYEYLCEVSRYPEITDWYIAGLGVKLWSESAIVAEPRNARFADAVSRLAQAGDRPARRIQFDDEEPKPTGPDGIELPSALAAAIIEAFDDRQGYYGPYYDTDWELLSVLRNFRLARVGDVEAALRRIASRKPLYEIDSGSSKPIQVCDLSPTAAAGALMWFETMLGRAHSLGYFGKAVGELAQAGDPVACRLAKVSEIGPTPDQEAQPWKAEEGCASTERSTS